MIEGSSLNWSITCSRVTGMIRRWQEISLFNLLKKKGFQVRRLTPDDDHVKPSISVISFSARLSLASVCHHWKYKMRW